MGYALPGTIVVTKAQGTVNAILVRVILVRRTKLSSEFGPTPDNLDPADPDNLDRHFWLTSNPAIKECISNL